MSLTWASWSPARSLSAPRSLTQTLPHHAFVTFFPQALDLPHLTAYLAPLPDSPAHSSASQNLPPDPFHPIGLMNGHRPVAVSTQGPTACLTDTCLFVR